MDLTLTFAEGVPDTPKGQMQYCFVRARSHHDGKVRVFGAWYLNAYPLTFDHGPCPDCPYPNGEKDCPGADGDGCPVTGWCEEKFDPDYESSYHKIYGEVLGYAAQPEPVTK